MSKKHILRSIFDETTNGKGKNRRYIARSYDGGSGWGVYDRIEDKFLSTSLKELNEDNFREPIN